MKIKYLGHSSFKITSSAGASIVSDPFESSIGYSMPDVTADAVTLSHHHFDHDYVQAVKGNPAVIEGGERMVGDIKVSSVQSFHDEVSGKKRGKNTIFKYQADGVTVCHLGDLGEPLTAERVNSIGNVDVLLIPVGGVYTIDADEAEKYVRAIAPAVVIPMHYCCEGCNLNISGVEKFAKKFNDVIYSDGNEFTFTSENSTGNIKIVILKK